jgi:uncharacterized protein YjbI with pentapeptide repeats
MSRSQSVVPELERLARVASSDATSLTRKELITVLLSATANTRLRARGLNFEGADLSNLDLSGMNLARAKLAGANLTHALLDGVSLQVVCVLVLCVRVRVDACVCILLGS